MSLLRNPPDPSSPAAFQIEPFLDVIRQRNRRLDDLAIEVGNVKGAIGPNRQTDWAKPVVG